MCTQVQAYGTRYEKCEWLGGRMATANIMLAIKNVILGWEGRPNAAFRSPVEGSTGAIWKKVAKPLPVKNQVGSLLQQQELIE